MYKIKNITKDPRKFREYKTAEFHFLRAGEEIIVNNEPCTTRFDVFEVTDLSKEKKEKPEKTKLKGGKINGST